MCTAAASAPRSTLPCSSSWRRAPTLRPSGVSGLVLHGRCSATAGTIYGSTKKAEHGVGRRLGSKGWRIIDILQAASNRRVRPLAVVRWRRDPPGMAAGSKSGKRRALIAVDDPAEARRIIAELERDGYECLWARTHGEMERIALEEPNLSIAHIAHDFTGGLAADPSRPRAPRPVDLQYFDPPVAAEIAPRASRIHEAIPRKTARALIVDDRPKKAARLRESLAGHSWLAPVSVTILDGLAPSFPA